jgi:hypothetical protein
LYALLKPQIQAYWERAKQAELDRVDFEDLLVDNHGVAVKPYLLRFFAERAEHCAADEEWSVGETLKDAIGRRLEALIEKDDDPEFVMNELAEAAERRGLIEFSNGPRRGSAWEFIGDLWYDNPATNERVNLFYEDFDPDSIVDLASALDAIR